MTSILTKNAMLLNHFFLKIKYFRYVFVSSLCIFSLSLSVVGSLPIEAALIDATEKEIEQKKQTYLRAREVFQKSYNSACLSYFLSDVLPSFFLETNVNHSPYEACESAFEKRDYRFIARSILYTAGLIGGIYDATGFINDLDDIDKLLEDSRRDRANEKIMHTVKINNKGKKYSLYIDQNILQIIEEKEHDSSVVLNNLRTIAAEDLLDNNLSTITKKNLLHRQHARITCGLSAAISCFGILKICKNRSLLNIFLGTLTSSTIGLFLGQLYWQLNKENPYPNDEEIDSTVTSWLQPKLTCGVLRLEEEARVISEHLTNNANLPTWRERKIDILQQDHYLPEDIAELILKFTP